MSRLTVGYCRVSSNSREQQQSLPQQVSLVERQGVDQLIQETWRGMDPERPGYQQLRRMIADGQVHEVIATEFSRLGRDAIEADQFVLLCDATATRVRTISDGILTMATADDLVMTRLRGSMAQAESMRLSTRIRRGQAEGRQQARPMRHAPWAYTMAPDASCLQPDPLSFPRARAFIEHLAASDFALVRALRSFDLEGIPLNGGRQFRQWLNNPVLRGGLAYPRHELILWDQHQPLWSHEEFASYEAAKRARRHHWGVNSTRRLRPLSSICRCLACGATLKYYAGRRQACLRCSDERCAVYFRSIREAIILDWLLPQLTTHAAHWLAQQAETREDPARLELQRQIDALEKLGDSDLNDAIAAKRSRLVQMQQQGATVDPELVQRISRPEWWVVAGGDPDALAVVLQAVVQTVSVDIQQKTPVGVLFRF